MPIDTSKQCVITNNSGKDIVVALAIETDETTSPDAIEAFSGQLEILITSDSSTVIKNSNTGTVTLNRSYVTNGNGYVHDYNLVLSDKDWIYPLAALPVTRQTINGTPGYAPKTLSADEETAISQAAAFYQTITVYPDTQLANDYFTALKQAIPAGLDQADGSPGSANAIADAMTNVLTSFFEKTTAYNKVTLADLVAVNNYYNNFPSVWAQYKNSLTYYLYGSDGTTATFAGTLSLQKSGPIDITKASGGYTCTFTPAVNPTDTATTGVDTASAVTLTYADGIFTNDTNAAAPEIALKGSFMLQKIFTGATDDKSVLTVMTGKANGVPCIGFDAPQTDGTSVPKVAPVALSGSIEKYWDTLMHPKKQHEWIVTILTFVGAVLLVPLTINAIYQVYRVIRSKAQTNEPLTRQFLENRAADISSNLLNRNKKSNQIWSEGDFTDDFFNIGKLSSNTKAVKTAYLLDKAVEKQRACLDQFERYQRLLGDSDKILLEKSFDLATEISNALFYTRFGELTGILPEQKSRFSKLQNNVFEIHNKIDKRMSEQAQDLVDSNQNASAAILSGIRAEEEESSREDADDDIEAKDIIKIEEGA